MFKALYFLFEPEPWDMTTFNFPLAFRRLEHKRKSSIFHKLFTSKE